MATVRGAPQVITEKRLLHVRLQAEIEELPDLVGLCHRVTAEHVILQNTRERPMNAGIGRVTPPTLSKVRGNIVELSPGDCHLVAICGINRNRTLVRSITNDVLAILINVDLVTTEHAELRDHSWRSLHFLRGSRRVIVFLQWLAKRRHTDRRELG